MCQDARIPGLNRSGARDLPLYVCFDSNNPHYTARLPYSTSSMTFIVSIVLLLASMAAARAPNSPLLDSYDYIGMNSSQTRRGLLVCRQLTFLQSSVEAQVA